MERRFTSITDFKKPDDSIDWDAYRKAQIENGEICYRCRGNILFGGKGYRDTCSDCVMMGKAKGDVTHDKFVRCPKCRLQFNAVGDDDYSLYEEGGHQVRCENPDCEHEFEVETVVSYTFRSPELLPEEKEEDGAEEDSVEEVPPDRPEGPAPCEGA